MELWQIFQAGAIAAYYKNVNANMDDPFIGTKYFPVAKQTGLELSWIKGYNNLPVALQPSAFDTKASLRDRVGVTQLQTEMPFFREAMRIGEKDRQNIETLLAKGLPFAQPAIQRIFDDIKNLVDGARVQAERLRFNVLFSGQINVSASTDSGRTVNYTYNYDVDGTWATNNSLTLAGTDTWTTTNKDSSDPINDLMDIKSNFAEKNGVELTEVILNTATLKGMLASSSIVKAMNPIGSASVIPTRNQKLAFVSQETNLTFTVYDKMFKDENGNDKKYVPDGQVALLPSYALGNTWYGTTPEEFDLMNGKTEAQVSIVDTGVAITTIKEAHPVNVQTIVSEIVLPSFERMTDVFRLTVF